MKGLLKSKLYILTSTIFLFSTINANAQRVQMGADIDGENSPDQSGFSVSMNAMGDRMAIGAPYNDGNGLDAGHVRIYEWDSTATAWIQMGTDIDGEVTLDLFGYSVCMNGVGDRLAIGAPLNDGNGINAGHVRIYEWDTTTTAWIQMGADIDGESIGDGSGGSVSMNEAGDRLAIGALSNGGNGRRAGHVRIYKWNRTAWIQIGADIDGEAAGDLSGNSVSLNALGNRLAIGARENDGNGVDAGHVRIFEWDTTTTAWIQMGADIDGESLGDGSGWSVSMNDAGDRLAIGAQANNGNGQGSGHVRIYEWDSTITAWIQMGADIDGEAVGDNSGSSVSMNGDGYRLGIGAVNNDGNGQVSGHVRIYEWDSITTAWAQMGTDIDGEAAGDNSGSSVSMNEAGDRLAIGASNNNGNGNSSGHVRVYIFNLTTLLGEVSAFDSFSIYPNPADAYISIESQNSIGEIVQITSITGALLLELTITKEKEIIDLSAFKNGLYFLRVGSKTEKIILSK